MSQPETLDKILNFFISSEPNSKVWRNLSTEREDAKTAILKLFKSWVPEERHYKHGYDYCTSCEEGGCGCYYDTFNDCRDEILKRIEDEK